MLKSPLVAAAAALALTLVVRAEVDPRNFDLAVKPGEFRANGPLPNLDEFAAAFATPKARPCAGQRRTRDDLVTRHPLFKTHIYNYNHN